jgi:DNA repair ATPase RecN
MGGYNPRAPLKVETRIRELEELARKYKKDQAEIDKTIKLLKVVLKELRKPGK